MRELAVIWLQLALVLWFSFIFVYCNCVSVSYWQLLTFSMVLLSNMYYSIEKENRDKVIAIAKERNIPVKQMKVDRGAYDLHAE